MEGREVPRGKDGEKVTAPAEVPDEETGGGRVLEVRRVPVSSDRPLVSFVVVTPTAGR